MGCSSIWPWRQIHSDLRDRGLSRGQRQGCRGRIRPPRRHGDAAALESGWVSPLELPVLQRRRRGVAWRAPTCAGEPGCRGLECTLDGMPNIKDLTDGLRTDGGYGFTHFGRLTRTDGRTFSSRSASDQLRRIGYALSFARGGWTLPVLLGRRGRCGSCDLGAMGRRPARESRAAAPFLVRQDRGFVAWRPAAGVSVATFEPRVGPRL